MTSTTFDLDPVLVSELPPTGETRPSLVARLRAAVNRYRAEREFENALRLADPAQAADLLALARRR